MFDREREPGSAVMEKAEEERVDLSMVKSLNVTLIVSVITSICTVNSGFALLTPLVSVTQGRSFHPHVLTVSDPPLSADDIA